MVRNGENMKTYTGRVSGVDMTNAIMNAKVEKPEVKNLYIRVGEKDETLEFVVRKHLDNERIEEHVVYTTPCDPMMCDEHMVETDGPIRNGFIACISVSKYQNAIKNGANPGLNMSRNHYGVGVACTF
jgi:hypothetical protein